MHGWTFLTGNREHIELLRHKLGIYDRDPAVDRDRTQHGMVVVGNDATDTWTTVPGLIDARVIVNSVLRVMSVNALARPGSREPERAGAAGAPDECGAAMRP